MTNWLFGSRGWLFAIRLIAAGAEHLLKRGELLTLGRVITHEAEGLEESAFPLTIVQPRLPRP